MSRHKVGILIMAGASLGLLGCAGETSPDSTPAIAQAFGLRSTAGADRAEMASRVAQLNGFLEAERPAGVMRTPVIVPVTAAELRSIDAPSADSGLVKVGLSKALATPAAFGRGQPHGALARTGDGGFVWAVAVRSPGASAMRLRFANVRLPDDADLYLYNDLGDAKGPYHAQGPNGSGSFWSHTLAGDTLIVQVRYFGPATEADIRATSVTVTGVGHLTRKLRVVASPESFCSSPDTNAACVEDASCYNVSAVADAKNADALYLWPSGQFFYICSGGLVADAAGSETPYFLTAHHCISKDRDAQNIEAFFGFRTDRCASTYPIACEDWRDLRGTGVLGATILATGSGSDFTLMQLSGAPPAGTAYLGWTNAPVAFSDGATLHRISHPSAAPQAYSRQHVDTGAPTCRSLPRGNFIYSRDDVGATEGGSSGSPVVNASGQVVGQLYGACGSNLNDTCDSGSNATVDGAFASYWDQVQPFLDPGTSAEVCDDGLDNDGDGATDCADPDCAGDPACSSDTCTGGQKFDPCTEDADCCSNRCRGPASKRSCR